MTRTAPYAPTWVIRFGRYLGVIALFFIAACSQPPKISGDFSPDDSVWRGRLAIKTEGEPVQSYSANFELRGKPARGTLSLYSPLGTTVAELSWSPDGAWLTAQGQRQAYASLDALMLQAVGTSVPVSALFDWLGGRAISTEGWEVDLSQQAQGRLFARRAFPQPVTELRVVLER